MRLLQSRRSDEDTQFLIIFIIVVIISIPTLIYLVFKITRSIRANTQQINVKPILLKDMTKEKKTTSHPMTYPDQAPRNHKINHVRQADNEDKMNTSNKEFIDVHKYDQKNVKLEQHSEESDGNLSNVFNLEGEDYSQKYKRKIKDHKGKKYQVVKEN